MSRIFTLFTALISLTSLSQNLKFHVVDYSCDENSKYIEYGKSEDVYIDGDGGALSEDSIKTVKIKGKNFVITQEFSSYTITPKKLGKSVLIAKVRLKNGNTLKLKQEFVIVEMPEIEVEISVTSPDSKFMWLNIVDKSTGQPINTNDYDICMLDFQLFDSAGVIKESGVYVKKDDFFPSVTLVELPTKFELNDKLYLGLSLIHKKYNLLVSNKGQIITITKLWK